MQRCMQFADKLGVKPQTVSSWITRNTFDIDLIYAKCSDINANWLLTGEGDMLKSDHKTPANRPDRRHHYGILLQQRNICRRPPHTRTNHNRKNINTPPMANPRLRSQNLLQRRSIH